MTFDEFVAAKGFDPANLSDGAREFLTNVWEDEETRPSTPPARTASSAVSPTVKDIDIGEAMRPLKEDYQRKEAILALVVEHSKLNPSRMAEFEAIGMDAIEKGKSLNDVKYELLVADRGSGPRSTFSREEAGISSKVLEAAICKHTGLASFEKSYDERTLDVADKKFKNGLSLVELIGHCAKQNGYRGMISKGNLETMLRHAYGTNYDLKAGASQSTYSLPYVLANVANKFLNQGFLSVDSAWRSIASTRSVPDFKATSTNAISSNLMYRLVPGGGNIEHGTVGETNYTNQANTYAIQLGIDRRDLINDDSGALSQASIHVGRGAGLKINDLFWTEFLNNSSHFASGNSNVSTGGGSALGTADGAAINAAEVIFMNQTDPQGFPLGIMPAIMLVPPTLRNTAARWMGSQVFTPSGTSGLGATNIFGGRYSIVSSPYMENSSYTGYSTAAWYLLANPTDLSTIEGVAVGGRWEPMVESSALDWNTLGISYRGWIDVGFNLQEPRAGVRSAGS